MKQLQKSFQDWSFDERNHLNEMNLMALALARIENVEDILYIQGGKAAIENKLRTRYIG